MKKMEFMFQNHMNNANASGTDIERIKKNQKMMIFSEIRPGDTFICTQELEKFDTLKVYIKTNEPQSCVDITTGVIFNIGNKTPVIPVDCNTVVTFPLESEITLSEIRDTINMLFSEKSFDFLNRLKDITKKEM